MTATVDLAGATRDVPCPCGRGTVIGTCTWTDSRMFFRAFTGGPDAFHFEEGAGWACADCVADTAVAIASGEVRETMRREFAQRTGPEGPTP